jgi:hypothetical protein
MRQGQYGTYRSPEEIIEGILKDASQQQDDATGRGDGNTAAYWLGWRHGIEELLSRRGGSTTRDGEPEGPSIGEVLGQMDDYWNRGQGIGRLAEGRGTDDGRPCGPDDIAAS